ncbi:MAG TPA: TPM domain-containing protein [Bacteroidales bacterium]|nr:TPM domain-containing protein [Bacteroidales bacterium]
MNYPTKFRSISHIAGFFLFVALILPMGINAQLPEPPSPPRLVVDLANILSESQEQRLEQKLVAYDDSTSTQILVLTVPDLQGYDPADYAYRIGQSWGVGRKGFNNGIVILIKPKTERSRGQAFIATGYGMEEKVPDARARRIVETEMIPSFRAGYYYEGIDKSVDAIIALAAGTYKGAAEDEMPLAAGMVLLAVVAFVVLIIILGGRGNHMSGGRMKSPDLWTLIWLASMGNKGHTGSWGRFSGGSGRSGGFGGGSFGGFGGGSFGGGGAGGSW